MAFDAICGFAACDITFTGQSAAVVSWFVDGGMAPARIPAKDAIHSTSPDPLTQSPIAPLYETTGTFFKTLAIPRDSPASQAIVPFAHAFT